MYYPYRIFLPTNISKLIPLSIKQTWVHYPNLCATGIPYQTFFNGLHQRKPTQLINIIKYLVDMDFVYMWGELKQAICTQLFHFYKVSKVSLIGLERHEFIMLFCWSSIQLF